MTPEQFTYWLQGFVEIGGGQPTNRQWEIIKDHLNLVFNKVTPNRNINYCYSPSPTTTTLNLYPNLGEKLCGNNIDNTEQEHDPEKYSLPTC